MIIQDRPYFRREIDVEFEKVKAKMHRDAIGRATDGSALFYDCYSGKILKGGDSYDYEHIRSSEEIFTKYRNQLTNEQIAIVVNCVENVGVTSRKINQSKGKRRMEDWLKSSLNLPEYNIDTSITLKTLKNADAGILRIAKIFF